MIDVTTTTEIEGVPDVDSLPEQQMIEIVEVEDGDGFQEVEDDIKLEQLAMEDDIEKEIEELENEPGGEMMDDDIEKEIAELKTQLVIQNKKMILRRNFRIRKQRQELKVKTNKTHKEPKEKTRNEKIKLLAMKIIELTKTT